VNGRVDLIAKADGVSTIPFMLSEDWPSATRTVSRGDAAEGCDGRRRGHRVHPEDWEGGFTLLLLAAHAKGERSRNSRRLEFINDEISLLLMRITRSRRPVVSAAWALG
jgi:hypothetical protein